MPAVRPRAYDPPPPGSPLTSYPLPPCPGVQPTYEWPLDCLLDPTKAQAYDELMSSSPSGIFADLIFALRDLSLQGEEQGAGAGRVRVRGRVRVGRRACYSHCET